MSSYKLLKTIDYKHILDVCSVPVVNYKQADAEVIVPSVIEHTFLAFVVCILLLQFQDTSNVQATDLQSLDEMITLQDVLIVVEVVVVLDEEEEVEVYRNMK
ncbi:hypothetical protein DPMN_035076 [Dreissena polymorpha]|uniref:Uncharacterized protein n=1 Tax=Dreissena polymorpha TaxID=45954 RepID=A0A9D4RK97_DREPO|nr:hypothetical protein DPMN_035076 [Dreissena polymorpha]